LNYLANICDFKKRGTTVTAIALERRPAAVVFWVVSNVDVKDKVVKTLEEILKGWFGWYHWGEAGEDFQMCRRVGNATGENLLAIHARVIEEMSEGSGERAGE